MAMVGIFTQIAARFDSTRDETVRRMV